MESTGTNIEFVRLNEISEDAGLAFYFDERSGIILTEFVKEGYFGKVDQVFIDKLRMAFLEVARFVNVTHLPDYRQEQFTPFYRKNIQTNGQTICQNRIETVHTFGVTEREYRKDTVVLRIKAFDVYPPRIVGSYPFYTGCSDPVCTEVLAAFVSCDAMKLYCE